jgi:NDP-4-keto-2,6-dideoxyhexose 3-C-methyltransferase
VDVSKIKSLERCRICGGNELQLVMSLGVQALTGVFPRSADARVTEGPLDLVKCTSPAGCGLVQLGQTYEPEEMYGANYGYRSGLNATMVEHLQRKVRSILELDVLRPGDVVIDIGSNDATTLRAYPANRFELVGIDPSGKKFQSYYPEHVRLVPDFFSARAVQAALGGRKAKVITSFSMFYDLEDPTGFAREVADSLEPEGVWVLEQSYLPTMLAMNSFDTVCHEHLEYYTLKQIHWIAEEVGLRILDVEFNQVNGGSFSVIVARTDSRHAGNQDRVDKILQAERDAGMDSLEVFREFVGQVDRARHDLVTFLVEARKEGKRVCGLGASTKGNVLLQYFQIDRDLLPEIGEVNPDKFGAFTPGTRIPLVPEDELLASEPDYLLVLPWHFREFFLGLPKLKGRSLVFPLPRFEIVKVGG